MKITLLMGLLVGSILSSVSADVDETGKITRIIVEGDSLVSVWLDGPDVVTDCAGGGRWTISNADDLLFKEKVSSLLAAASSNKSVHLHHLTYKGCGHWESNKIYYVDIQY